MGKNKVIITESNLYSLIENAVISVLGEIKNEKPINEGARTDFVKGAFKRAYNNESNPKNNSDDSFSWGTFINGKPNKTKHNHAMASRDIPGKREHYTNIAGMTEPGFKGKLTRAAAAGATMAGSVGRELKNKLSKNDDIKEAASKPGNRKGTINGMKVQEKGLDKNGNPRYHTDDENCTLGKKCKKGGRNFSSYEKFTPVEEGRIIRVNPETLMEMVYNTAKKTLREFQNDFDMESPEYREMYDGPDKRWDDNVNKAMGYDRLDAVGDEWLTHKKEDEDEEFPRIAPGRSAEQELSGEWDDLSRPGSYNHVRGFLRQNGKSIEDVEAYIKQFEDKYGEPTWRNQEFRENYENAWEGSELASLRDKYFNKYRIKYAGNMGHFPYDSPYSEFDYFGALR